MLMNKAQEALYWREWAAVKAARPEMDRHELHRRSEVTIDGVFVRYAPESHKDFDNDDFSAVLSTFRAISRPNDLGVQVWHANEARRKIVWQITRFPEPYWQKIARDKFGCETLNGLCIEQLEQLRNTLAARKAAKKKRESELVGGPF